MQFNERLKELRLKKGISQAELAKAIFVSRSAVAKWENGLGLPSETSLNLLAEYFSISKEEFFADKQTETIIVSKNITIAKSQKLLIIVSCVGLAIILSLILALIFVPKLIKQKATIGHFDVSGYELPILNDKLSISLGCKPENIFVKNGGEIRTNENGRITYLSIDAFAAYEKDNHSVEMYSIQLQLQNETDCVIIKEPVSKVGGERVPLGSVFNAIALWNDANDHQTNFFTRFMIDTAIVTNPAPNGIGNQWLYSENELTRITVPHTGLCSMIIVLTDNTIHAELYITIKG